MFTLIVGLLKQKGCIQKSKTIMKFVIRAYNKNDKDSCLAAFKSNVPKYFTEEEIEDFEDFLVRIEDVCFNNNNKTHYFVVEHKQMVIGCGGFGDKDGKEIISLAWGLIRNEFHNKGYGKALLRYRLERIKELYPELPLVLDTTQYSHSFFEKYGFYTTKITNDFYSKGLHRYDMILKS
jgi:[ribosomal protein S18]-alanine N-acetyltransferase